MMKLELVLVLFLCLWLPTHVGATESKNALLPCKTTENPAYDAKIKEYTTEPFFLTELVDHLPLSSCVPAPDVHLGHIVGAPDSLTYSKDINAYMRLLASKSPRMKVFDMGRSEEGRDTLLIAVSDEKNIAQLDRYRDINARLADPRKLTNTEGEKLVLKAKPIYWVTGGTHAMEAAAPEMMMELAYRLAVDESAFIQKIRQNTIILLTPILDVDGHDRYVDIYRWNKSHPQEKPKPMVWWGHYVAHDTNRDALVLSLSLSRSAMEVFLKFHPQILHDLHEPVAYLMIGTGVGFYNAWLDPIVINEQKQMALYEVQEMTKRGVPGVKYENAGLGPFTLISTADTHNAIGRLYETLGFRGADTFVHTAFPEEQWVRPDPPLPKVRWSLRNNVNVAQSALLLGMDNVATHAQLFMRNFLLKSRRSVQKPYNEGPAAYIFPADDQRSAEQARLLNLLKRHGVEVHRLSTGYNTGNVTFPAGSYVVRMDQPYSRVADIMLDVGYYNPRDPSPYDETGWTLSALRNVKVVRVKDLAVLSAPMDKVEGDIRVMSSIDGSGHTYLINHTTDNNLATLRFRLADIKMDAAEQPFEVGGHKFRAGTFVIRTVDRARLAAAATELGVSVYATDAEIKVSTHSLSAPRIALVHNWINTRDDGWARLAFDNLKIPYTYFAETRLGEIARIRDKFDVVILPQGEVHEGIKDLIRSATVKGTPVSWKNTAETPNLVAEGLDSADDISGGLGIEGVLKLEKFVSEGGLLIAITSSVSLPVETGIANVSASQPRKLEVLGSVLKAQFDDKSSPIAYGYDDTIAVHYSTWYHPGPILGSSRGLGGPQVPMPIERGSGRGSPTDPDVIQGRPPYTPRFDDTQLPRAPDSTPDRASRVVLRYAPESELLVSGSLKGGSELADTGVVVDAPHGKGHVVLFASNPFWREETQGSFFLVFNAIFNYERLDAGRDSGKR
jgi:hypothetical protein